MHILETPWFISLVEKRTASATGRLQAVFDISEEWVNAPGIREQFGEPFTQPAQLPQLHALLCRESLRAGARQHSVLAAQLLMLLSGAINQQLRQPDVPAIQNAAQASAMLIRNACRQPAAPKWVMSGFAATLLLGIAFFGLQPTLNHKRLWTSLPASQRTIQPVALQGDLSPDEIEAVLALHERIAKGECRAPHLAMLPPGEMSAYMNIIELRKSPDPVRDGAQIRAFMSWFSTVEGTECYPAHTNDHINAVWVNRKPI